jgi:hypothetical protein
MNTIKHVETLVYYDGVQVFEGRDAGGAGYIGVMTSRFDEVDEYLVTKVEQESLNRFRVGAVDLRTLLLSASVDGWYLMRTGGDFSRPLALASQHGALDENDLLPDAGFLLPETIQAGD